MPRQPKKLVEAHQLSDDDDKDGFQKGCALIRANLGLAPTVGSYEEWAAHYAEALWLEKFRNRNLAEMLSGMFGGKASPRRPPEIFERGTGESTEQIKWHDNDTYADRQHYEPFTDKNQDAFHIQNSVKVTRC